MRHRTPSLPDAPPSRIDSTAADDSGGGPATPSIETVIDGIKDLIAGEYGPGALLPTERELSERLGVSRNTVRAGLHTLAYLGVVEPRRGSGTRVAGSGETVFHASFEYLMLLDRPDIDSILSTRALIEVNLAGLAATHRTTRELADIEDAAEAVKRYDDGTPPAGEANRQFHLAIARAAHNPMQERILSCLMIHRSKYMQALAPQPGDTGIEEIQEPHERLVEAIRARDPEAARAAMALDLHIGAENVHALEERRVAAAPTEHVNAVR